MRTYHSEKKTSMKLDLNINIIKLSHKQAQAESAAFFGRTLQVLNLLHEFKHGQKATNLLKALSTLVWST